MQLKEDEEVHFLVNLGARAEYTLRFLSFLGIPASRIVPMRADTLFCAKSMLYSDTEVRRRCVVRTVAVCERTVSCIMLLVKRAPLAHGSSQHVS
jgi:hypothetical protein